MTIRTLTNKANASIRNLSRYVTPHVTRTRLMVFAVTLILVGISLGGIDPEPPEPNLEFGKSLALELPTRDLPADPAIQAMEEVAALSQPIAEPWESVEIRTGQTLGEVFRQQSFSLRVLHDILALNEDTKQLTRIRPGDVFDFQRHADGSLSRMRYPVDEASYLLVENGPDGLRASRQARQIYREPVEAQGQIETSLFMAAKAAGMSDNLTMQLANIFGWDIDFVLDIRAGDRFFLVYEKVYRDGEFLRDGEILAATFVNQGERFRAIRFEDSDGVASYYAPDGRPMKKAFLRAPLNFSYISSNFNPKRFHPILRRVKAHNGIDYRAPTGTPVYAAGAGRVVKSAYDKYNGHHVFVQHPGSIVTKYLHFNKRLVKKGQSVRQGQTIGTVGSTGMSTAPHLHYEFLVNGVHRNPRTVPLPQVASLEGDLLTRFKAHAAPYQNQLSRIESASLYAQAE